MCPLRVKPGPAHFDRQLVTVCKLLPETFLPCFVLEMFISLVVHLVVMVMCWSCAPSCIVTVMVPPFLQQPLFLCNFSRFWAFFLQLPPLASVSSTLAFSSLCCCCCASSLSLASLSSLPHWISATVSPCSNFGTLSVGIYIFLTLLPFLGHFVK